jgi:hypothetical protein
MKYRRPLACLCAFVCMLAFAACDARLESSGKLISSYFKLAAGSAETVTVLDVATCGDGYLAAAMFSGSGGRLALYKIVKENGAERIAAVSEGEKARVDGFSVNTLTDGGRTIVYGDIAAGTKDFNKIEVAFDDGSKASDSLAAGKGYIVVADGEKKLKDLVLTGPQKDKKADLTTYLKDGGSLTTAGFVEVREK